jgi:indole-3-glycerol phosphate synthase
LINPGINSVLRAKLYEENGASAISILTDEKWFKGSFDELKEVATHVRVPVLMKDFIIDPIQLHLAASYGASMVLLIVKLLKNELKRYFELCYEHDLLPLVEISNEEEFEIALQTGCPLIGVNSRDLDTLEVDFRKFFRLSDLVKKAASYGTLVVAESGLSTREEVMDVLNLGYHGVLIGTRLSQADGVEFLQTITSAKLNGGDF